MNPKKYKKHIKKEYERLFENKNENEDYLYYYFVMYSDVGVEGWKVVRRPEDIRDSEIQAMMLRARFNSHRHVGVYAFTSDKELNENIITPEFLVNKNVIKIY